MKDRFFELSCKVLLHFKQYCLPLSAKGAQGEPEGIAHLEDPAERATGTLSKPP